MHEARKAFVLTRWRCVARGAVPPSLGFASLCWSFLFVRPHLPSQEDIAFKQKQKEEAKKLKEAAASATKGKGKGKK